MDGAEHIVRTLLSPERLRQRAAALPVQELLRQITACAVPETAKAVDRSWLRQQWEATRSDVGKYLTELSAGRVPPNGDEQRILGRLVEAVMRPIHLAILREDLPVLAKAIRAEGDGAPADSIAWLEQFDAATRTSGLWPVPADEHFRLWDDAGKIGKEKIEAEAGGDDLARTASHLAAVTVNAMGAVTRPKAVTSVLKALRGYTLMVWAMVAFMTSPSKFGRRAVELAVAAGGSLLALAVLVPAIPLAIILTGVLLVVAGVSAAALQSDRAKGVGWRLGVVGLIVAASLGGYLYWDWRANGLAAGFVGALVKIGVFLLIVLLGWWISTARPGRRDETAKAGSREAADRRRVRKMTRSGQ